MSTATFCVAWQLHQGFRAINTMGAAISRSSILCRSMLKLINSLLHYLTFEVLEPNWHLMHDRLQTVKSIDEKVEKLKSVCLQYAASVQLLIPAAYISDIDNAVDSTVSFGEGRSKTRRSARSSIQSLKLAAENNTLESRLVLFVLF